MAARGTDLSRAVPKIVSLRRNQLRASAMPPSRCQTVRGCISPTREKHATMSNLSSVPRYRSVPPSSTKAVNSWRARLAASTKLGENSRREYRAAPDRALAEQHYKPTHLPTPITAVQIRTSTANDSPDVVVASRGSSAIQCSITRDPSNARAHPQRRDAPDEPHPPPLADAALVRQPA
jgi:hypothetical protein